MIDISIKKAITQYRETYGKQCALNIGVLVSGGVDSMVLLYSLIKVRLEEDFKITVLNVNFDDFPSHEKATKLVEQVVKENDLDYITMESKISSMKSGIKETVHNELKEISFKKEFDIVMSGHHEDDQIETILFRFLRGSSPEGLKGMRLFNNYRLNNQVRLFCKPFLNITKNDILFYAKENKITYVEDETNFNNDSDRNFLRNEIIPKLKDRFNVKSVLNTVDILHESTKYEGSLDIHKGEWEINDLINIPVGNRVFIVKEFMRLAIGINLNKSVQRHLTEAFSSDLSNLRVYLTGGFMLRRDRNKIVVDYVKSA